jgi:hypothetical protein
LARNLIASIGYPIEPQQLPVVLLSVVFNGKSMQPSRIAVLLLIFLATTGFTRVPSETASEFYQRGLEYKRKGQWVKALGTWFASSQL